MFHVSSNELLRIAQKIPDSASYRCHDDKINFQRDQYIGKLSSVKSEKMKLYFYVNLYLDGDKWLCMKACSIINPASPASCDYSNVTRANSLFTLQKASPRAYLAISNSLRSFRISVT